MRSFAWSKYCHKYVWLSFVSILVTLCIQVFLSYILLRNDNLSSDELPILLWWTPFTSYSHIIECTGRKYRCLITSNRTISKADVYLFYGSNIENHDFPIPRDVNIPWALFHEESPRNYAPILFKNVQSLFNITATFSQNSHFPITLQYLSRTEFHLLSDQKFYMPVKLKNKLLGSIAPILYIQSDCDTPSGRDYLVEELAQYVKIDSYGKCLNNKEFPKMFNNIQPLDLYNEDYLYFISKYKFIIAFENAVCDDYITEKLWRPLIVGAIPIYFGAPTVEKWLPNPNSAILVKNFDNVETLAQFINKVNANDTLYNSFLLHKIHSNISNECLKKEVVSDNVITAFQCFICEKVHEGTLKTLQNVKSIYNCPKFAVSNKTTWDQHWDIGKCQAQVLNQFINRGIPYDNEYFDEMWKKKLLDRNC